VRNVSRIEANDNSALLFGQRVREFRTARKLTLPELSRLSRMSTRRCAEIEWGAGDEVLASEVVHLAWALNVNSKYLFQKVPSAGCVVIGEAFEEAPTRFQIAAMRVLARAASAVRRTLRIVTGGDRVV